MHQQVCRNDNTMESRDQRRLREFNRLILSMESLKVGSKKTSTPVAGKSKPKKFRDLNFRWGIKVENWKLKRASKVSFTVDGASLYDAKQGDLNDCFLAAAACLVADRIHTFLKHYPVEGRCVLKLHSGREIEFDDRLPVDKTSGELLFLKSTQKGEIWPALFEKGFAKVYGGYDKLDKGGKVRTILGLLIGGTEFYQKIGKVPCVTKGVFRYLKEKLDKGAKVSIGTKDHAYAVLYADEKCIKVKNPWASDERDTRDGTNDGVMVIDDSNFDDFEFVDFSGVENI